MHIYWDILYLINEQITEDNVGRGSIIYIHKLLTVKKIYFHTINHTLGEGVFYEINITDNDELICALLCGAGKEAMEKNELLIRTLEQMTVHTYSHQPIPRDFNLQKINWELWTTCAGPDCYDKN